MCVSSTTTLLHISQITPSGRRWGEGKQRRMLEQIRNGQKEKIIHKTPHQQSVPTRHLFSFPSFPSPCFCGCFSMYPREISTQHQLHHQQKMCPSHPYAHHQIQLFLDRNPLTFPSPRLTLQKNAKTKETSPSNPPSRTKHPIHPHHYHQTPSP